MAKYIVLTAITIIHPGSPIQDDYGPGRIVELADYTAAPLLEKKCIQPIAGKRKGIIKLKELENGTDN